MNKRYTKLQINYKNCPPHIFLYDTRPIEQIYETEEVVMSKDEIIDFLENKIEALERTLKVLENYYGEEYLEAAKELEEFLQEKKVKEYPL